MKLSIIVPVLNEAEVLPSFLETLVLLLAGGAEVIVVDGGSSDGTVQIIQASKLIILQSPPGRARQMNVGAAQASGDVFLFLHADTLLPAAAYSAIKRALTSAIWGRFDVNIDGRPWMLRVVARLMNFRSRLTGIATGDQAMFVTRQAFEAVGGFPELPLMEDVEMSKCLKRLSPPQCLREKVTTSGRRWETRGVWRTIFLMWRLRWHYWRGVDVQQLARTYR